ncbi:MAG TPA: hypothetical protein VJH65_03945 [Candidatus Nanoarchaeia archaeon]|nr:hypothetical protein [Candidatus Nanoarchaeia archaeon]
MASKKQKEHMIDYLFGKLEEGGHTIETVTKEIVPGKKSNYFRVDDDGLVLLIDSYYTNDSLEKIYRDIKQTKRNNLALVFLKDGKTFFRNAAERHDFKRKYGLSLKNYKPEETHQMILFRPEEIFMNDRRNYLQYYQPVSERLKEGLISFTFKPVNFDYSHIDPGYQFRPQDRDSIRLHIWKERNFTQNSLVLEDGLLRELKS